MNGELQDLCDLALSANRALKEKSAFQTETAPYILSRRFIFSEQFGFAGSAEQWFSVSVKRGMHAVNLIVPVKYEKRGHLGFANESRAYLVLYRKDRGPSVLTPFWNYDQQKKGWNITYREREWVDKPVEPPVFADETEAFEAVLKEIEDLAEEIHEPFFASRFSAAGKILTGKTETEHKRMAELPEPYGRILEAVSCSDVFGGMGSWNDCPPFEAREIGRGEDYERLSDELLRCSRACLMYAVNTCYLR